MEIKSLKHAALAEIVDCLVASFADYFVQMPADVAYWESRFAGARVDYSLSYGMFDKGKLLGFIMQGIDRRQGERVAFNTGTGVLPAYRGQQVVDRLYAFALPELKAAGVNKCALEVIQKNEKAIRVYERIGFKRTREYKCFRGELNPPVEDVFLHETAFEEIEKINSPYHPLYSWDNCNGAIRALKDVYKSYILTDKADTPLGFFVIHPLSGYLAQFEVNKPEEIDNWKKLFAGIAAISKTVKINNIDSRRKEVISILPELGLENHVDQYEMEMPLNK